MDKAKSNNVKEYLLRLGFKPVWQLGEGCRFQDPTYLYLEGLYAELHDDNRFFLWADITNPLIDTIITKETLLEIQLEVIKYLKFYEIDFEVKT